MGGHTDFAPDTESSARLSLRYCVECADVFFAILGNDITAVMIFFCVSGVSVDPETGDWPSGVLTNSISCWRVSKLLGIPYETARRHLGKLVARGVCRKTTQGYSVAPDAWQTPPLDRSLERIGQKTLVLYGDFGAARPLFDLPPEHATKSLLAIGRLGLRHFVATLTTVSAETGLDFAPSLLFMRLYWNNVEHLGLRPGEIVGDAVWPDDLRVGLSRYRIAQNSNTSYETVRRQVRALHSAGYVETDQAGRVVVPGHVITGQAVSQAAVRTRRLTSNLATRIERRLHGAKLENGGPSPALGSGIEL